MLVVISPAKRLDWDSAPRGQTEPRFQREANRLAAHARQLPLRDLKSLMDLSDDLARLNRDRFRAFSDAPAPDQQRAAAFAFAGDTYQGLEAGTLDDDALRWAQDRLRILSGLYGVLKPLDGIQPYRLEMGSRMKTRRGRSLYDFWGDGIARALAGDARAVGTDTLLNCASQEYFGAVALSRLGLRVVTPVFQEDKNGVPKVISFFAKRARGAMARYVLENRIETAEGITGFAAGGYGYVPEDSTPDQPVFRRPYAPAG